MPRGYDAGRCHDSAIWPLSATNSCQPHHQLLSISRPCFVAASRALRRRRDARRRPRPETLRDGKDFLHLCSTTLLSQMKQAIVQHRFCPAEQPRSAPLLDLHIFHVELAAPTGSKLLCVQAIGPGQFSTPCAVSTLSLLPSSHALPRPAGVRLSLTEVGGRESQWNRRLPSRQPEPATYGRMRVTHQPGTTPPRQSVTNSPLHMLPGLVSAWRSRGCGPASQAGLLCPMFARDDAASTDPNTRGSTRTASDPTEQSVVNDEPVFPAQDWEERASVTSRQNYPLSGRLQTSLGELDFGGRILIRDSHLSVRPNVDARIAVAPLLLKLPARFLR